MDTEDVLARILAQRAGRYSDAGPSLAPAGTARFRLETDRLWLAYASAATGRSPELVARVLDYARPRRLLVRWLVVPQRPGEAELGTALSAARFRLTEDSQLMACRDRITVARNIPGVTVALISNPAQMLAYEYGNRLCFYDESQPSAEAVKRRAAERWREQQGGWFRYYAALTEGRLVAGCYASLFEDIPTIMGVFTLPQVRRRGVASQLLTYTVGDLLSPEHDACCLFVERPNPARNLYLELGFVPLVDMLTFELYAG